MEGRPSQNQPATARLECTRCTTVTATPLQSLARRNTFTDQVRGAQFTKKKKKSKKEITFVLSGIDVILTPQITSVTTSLLSCCALPPPPPPPYSRP